MNKNSEINIIKALKTVKKLSKKKDFADSMVHC